MAPEPRDSTLPLTPIGGEIRRTGRVRCQNVRSSVGEVIDVSGCGARVRAKSRPHVREGQQFELTMHILGRDVSVGARAIWVRKRAWRRWELGLQFTDVGDAARESLRDLARAEAINERILPDKRRRAG